MGTGYDEYGNQYDSPAGQAIIKAQRRGFLEGQEELNEMYKKEIAERKSALVKIKDRLRRWRRRNK